ncbi:hypothetical protein QJS04_geneDACA007671 [Acorus gramineus]|uniref:Cucumisin n=1 Tax=Acorus gramineus TaxID=55184 RepID=A0AAV9B647_ACOGR|nr:hypothetical protein QJS04_geneDACA007671 [Acorus gramineus]
MKNQASYSSLSWLFVFLASLVVVTASLSSKRQAYIVYMGERPNEDFAAESIHANMLEQIVGSGASQHLIHSYKRSFNGFVASLSADEAQKIKATDGVVSVFPNRINHLHTTRSWSFMGFPLNATHAPLESDIIIGMLDTGVWPESSSFNDTGLGPPPSKWKGICQSPSNFTCNNKIIGARFYNSGGAGSSNDILSPRDTEGHGSHTASTAAGATVAGASLYGLAQGTAHGAVPSARLAVYKICWSFGCTDADILAAFDDAIADGVDVISLSVGSPFASDYFEDPIAIGAFHAMKRGVLTSNSAGNSGPGRSTVSNFSPWSLTVAASTIDRKFVADVKLGNGKTYEGLSVNTFDLKKSLYPLVYAGSVPNTSAGYDGSTSRFCQVNSLDTTKVKGKIVLCDELSDAEGPLDAGAVGAIMLSDEYKDFAFSYPLPATVFQTPDIGNITYYINTTSNPTANILKSAGIYDAEAPVVVSFSSRGPNLITSDILKPDLTAPGVDILAAWSPLASMSIYKGDTRSVQYNIISGTSMSCPHASGAAAYVKSFHPTWSPAAIKSALMTTANPMNSTSNTDAEFAYGAGHINPIKAVNPGLIYDAGEADYVSMLCGQGYNTTKLRLVTGDNSTCSTANNSTARDLNYPSMAVTAVAGMPFTASFNRTVTNVGFPSSTYHPTLILPSGVKFDLIPDTLSFKAIGESQSFTLKLEGETSEFVVSASLVWSDGVHGVRSPIVLHAPSVR